MNEEINEVEVQEEALALYEAVKRLNENEDFKLVIKEKYLKASVLDNVSLLAHPAIKKNGERPDVMEELVAKSNLNLFLINIEQTGEYLTNETAEEVDTPEIDEEN